MKSMNLKTALLLILFLCISTTGLAQDEPVETSTAVVVQEVVDKGPEDALNRGTPRGSIVGYLEASSELDFEKASQYLDLRNLPAEVEALGGSELARQLNHVLSATVADWVSASEEIKPNFKIVQAQPTIVLHVPHVTVSTEADHAAKVIVECTVASLGESITNEQSHWPAASQKSEVRVLLRLERY